MICANANLFPIDLTCPCAFHMLKLVMLWTIELFSFMVVFQSIYNI